jgi:peptidoglycan/xylan/chitin deacetylase (PgdA/CDA1 family)
MFIHQIPAIIPKVLPKLTWQYQTRDDSREVYFTFDDGPTPEITNFVLDCLDTYSFKATFFCIGKNMLAYPELVQVIIDKGHSIGNHTMNHANAWKYKHQSYMHDYQSCLDVIQSFGVNSVGFRPPYGRITSYIYHQISQLEPVYMWTYLSGDYNKDLSPSDILRSAKQSIKPGCILVFHDSVKAFPRLQVVIPELLEFCKREKYLLKAL